MSQKTSIELICNTHSIKVADDPPMPVQTTFGRNDEIKGIKFKYSLNGTVVWWSPLLKRDKGRL